ncbi:MAG: hypothetical protein JWR52_362 [Marmoricola sp.]|nr:hypothetical protein [Marmoricola sp.]
MNLWNVAAPLLVLAFVISRQLQARPVREERPYRLMLVLAVIGAVEVVQYAGSTTVPIEAWALLAVTLVIGTALGALRGALVHVWRNDGVLTRQGNATTVVLWVLGLTVHFGVDAVIAHVSHPARELGGDALLLYLALVLGAQRFVTLQRADQREAQPVG